VSCGSSTSLDGTSEGDKHIRDCTSSKNSAVQNSRCRRCCFRIEYPKPLRTLADWYRGWMVKGHTRYVVSRFRNGYRVPVRITPALD
jgi:hypothetical protein